MKAKTKKPKRKFQIPNSKFQIILFVALGLFVLLNIFVSQTISSLYFQLANEERSGAVSFLKAMRFQPEFYPLLSVYKKIYGESFVDEVFAQERAEKQLINNFEQILIKNPKARDVLYSLFLLYSRSGEKAKAQQYLQQAKEIDPTLDN